jgi:hypothetical protein
MCAPGGRILLSWYLLTSKTKPTSVMVISSCNLLWFLSSLVFIVLAYYCMTTYSAFVSGHLVPVSVAFELFL